MVDMASLAVRMDTSDLRRGKRDLGDVSTAAGGAERSADRAGRAFGGMSAAMVAAAAAAAALGAALAAGKLLGQFIDATVTAEASQAQLGAAILSTGGAAGRSIEQLNAHAASLQRITNFGDEATNAMQGVLLTFTQVRGDQFDAATVAVMDLATAMGTDLSTAALQVGRALNDPVLGMTALSRSGIQFTEAQKEMVRQLVASNDVIGAQTIILAELETQFGGSAAAARDTLGGALGSLRNAFGDLFELSGPGSEALRASIERLTAAVANPEFFAAVQSIGTGLFKAAEIGVNALVGLSEAFTTLADNLDLVAISVGVLGAMKVPALVISLSAMATSGALAAGAMATLALAMNLIPAVALFTGLALAATTLYRGFTESTAGAAAFEGAIARVVSVQDALNTATERFYNNVTQRNLDAMLQVARDAVATAETALDAARAEAEAASFMVTLFGAGIGVDRLTEAADAVTQLALDLFDAETSLSAAEHAAANFASGLGDAEDNAGAIARSINGLSFANAVTGASALAVQLGIGADEARAINAAMNEAAGIPEQAAPSTGLSFGLGTVDTQTFGDFGDAVLEFGDNAETARRRVQSLTTSLDGQGGTGGGVATAAAAAAAEIEELTTFAQGMGAALQGGTKDAVEMGREFGGSLLRGIGSVSDAFGDFIMRGFTDFKGFVASILDSFKSMLAQMISMAVRNRIMLSIGASGGGVGQAVAGVAGKGGGGFLSNLLRGGGGAGAKGAGGGGGLLGAFGSGSGLLGLGGGSGLLGLGAGSGLATGIGSLGVGAGLAASLSVAIPIIGAVALAFSAFRTKTKVLDEGIQGNITNMGVLANTYKTVEKSRFFGLSKKISTTLGAVDAQTMSSITGAVQSLQTAIMDSASTLNVGADAFDRFSYSFKVSGGGGLEGVIAASAEAFAGLIPGLQGFVLEGEKITETLDRLVTSLTLVNTRMGDLGLNTYDVSVAGAGAAAAFAGLFGSLENFNAVSQSYYQNFYTDAERVARATELLSIEMLALGIDALPSTRAAFRALVDEADALGDSGLVASLMQLSPAFAEISAGANALGNSLRALVNEDLFATGQDYIRALSRAGNDQAFTPRESDAHLRAELRALNVSMERLVSSSEITAGNTGRGADAADDTLAFQLEQTL